MSWSLWRPDQVWMTGQVEFGNDKVETWLTKR